MTIERLLWVVAISQESKAWSSLDVFAALYLATEVESCNMPVNPQDSLRMKRLIIESGSASDIGL